MRNPTATLVNVKWGKAPLNVGELMGEWIAQILSSERPGKLEIELAKYLNSGWKIKGYSVDDKHYYALLIKESKD